jgi:glyceraldehyde 3-phosphate dehydrogenase
MVTKIAINGFGRIGRCITRALFEAGASEVGQGAKQPSALGDVELVGINDLTSAEALAHLLAFDSVHGRFSKTVETKENALVIDGKRIPVFAEKDPAKLPWKETGASIVIESTGLFTNREGAKKHIDAGAQRVIISAPGGSDIDGTFCVGINLDTYDKAKHFIVSNASCTTNCLAPVAKVIHESFGLLKGHMVTVHSYTNDQRTLDLPHKDLRRARAAALNMIPTSTGAAKAIGLVLPALKGKLDGTSIRVPTPNVSIVCLTAQVGKKTTRDEVNAALKAAAGSSLKGVLQYEERPLVSSDFIGNPFSSIVDAAQTQVIGDDLVEVQAWYDNEWGFSNRMLDLVRFMSK